MDINAGRDLCTVEGEYGNTPLHSSCENGNLEIVKVIYLNIDYIYVCIPYNIRTYNLFQMYVLY